MRALDTISISGFKSIRHLSTLKLGALNILIGANGAGKSNFIQFFRLLESMSRGNLEAFVEFNGGAETLCFNGEGGYDACIRGCMEFGPNTYQFTLAPTPDDALRVSEEKTGVADDDLRLFQETRKESRLLDWQGQGGCSGVSGTRNVCGHIYDAISSWRVYHFHDTSNNAPLRKSGVVGGDKRLLQDGANIAPFLLYLKQQHKNVYHRIVETVQLVAPFFVDFALEAESKGPEGREICKLRWRQKGAERLMQSWQLSDGTLRFIALAVALMQPMPPSTILIDEPELGLHPRALSVFQGLAHEAAHRMQVIITTQSPAMLSSMEPENIIVTCREHGMSRFSRLNAAELQGWLENFTLEDLWRKNVIQAGPDYE